MCRLDTLASEHESTQRVGSPLASDNRFLNLQLTLPPEPPTTTYEDQILKPTLKPRLFLSKDFFLSGTRSQMERFLLGRTWSEGEPGLKENLV